MSSFHEALPVHTAPDGGIFGVVVAVADPTGRIVFSDAGGRRSRSHESSPDLNTTFWSYSFTKILTTISALQLVERGLIGLDQCVEDIIPELKNSDIISTTDDTQETFTLNPSQTKITLRHLLTHTSGIGYDDMNQTLRAWRRHQGEPEMAMCGDVIKAYSVPLLFEPGSSWSYGGGVDWVGQIIERLTGLRLGKYMDKEIFSKLGMHHTTFNIQENPRAKLNLMEMSLKGPDGTMTPMESPYPVNAPTDSGGMGVVTSVGDFILVLADMIKDTPQLLEPSTRDQMFRPQFDPNGKQAEAMLAAGFHKNLTGEDNLIGTLAFGLGGLITVKDTHNLPAGTLGWGGMPNLLFFMNKERGVAACYGTQMMPPMDESSISLFEKFAREAWKYSGT